MFWIYFGFCIIIGAAIGSFLNVVIYRLPAGLSIISPPSYCPKCQTTLAWYDNVPVIGWFLLGARCRYCKVSIPIQYPLVEAILAASFGAWYLLCYASGLRPMYQMYEINEPVMTAPIFALELILLAALFAATMIDARHYIIPLEITWFVAAVALVIAPITYAIWPDLILQVQMNGVAAGLGSEEILRNIDNVPLKTIGAVRAEAEVGTTGYLLLSLAPSAGERLTAAAFGGMIGLLLAFALLWAGILPQSFPDLPEEAGAKSDSSAEDNKHEADHQPVLHEGDRPFDPLDVLHYPGARKEALKELVYLLWPVVGALVGLALMRAGWLESFGRYESAVRVLGGVCAGYLIGGGVVWAVRVFGTLGFGKEAMGLGDVHLMAAVGAVASWPIAVIAFFGAAFLGLGYALIALILAALGGRQARVLPYGPHLAVATVIVMIFQEEILYRAIKSTDGVAFLIDMIFAG